MRRIFRRKRDGVTRDWRKLHNKEHNYLYSSPIIRVIISRRMIWADHVARMGERTGVCRFWLELLREGDQLEDSGLGGKIILR